MRTISLSGLWDRGPVLVSLLCAWGGGYIGFFWIELLHNLNRLILGIFKVAIGKALSCSSI